MLISIVTAVYNRREVIGSALASMASQSYASREHVLIDGASTDGTLELLRARMQPGMTLVSEPDGGIYEALNKGISRAKGDVIGYLHSDDLFAKQDVLARVAAQFADPKVDAVYGDLQYVSASDTSRVIRHWTAGRFDPALLRRGWMPPHPTLFLRREVFQRFGTYDTSYRIAADYDAILRYFGKGAIRSAYIPEVLVKMRVGGESNKSLHRILQKSREDYRALRQNEIGGLGTLVWKNFSKFHQFFDNAIWAGSR